MIPSLRTKTKIVFVCLVLSIACYVIFLLVTNYLAQEKMIESFDKQLHYAFEKQALVVNYFFIDREQDLGVLAHSTKLNTYFENKALGMSEKYGLATNLMAFEQCFNTFWNNKNKAAPIYEWLALIDTTGEILTIANKTGDPLATDILRRIPELLPEEFFVKMESVAEGEDIIVSLPYYFKNTLKGYVVGGISLKNLYKKTITFNEVYESSNTYLYCLKQNILFPENAVGLSTVLQKNIVYSPAGFDGLSIGEISLPGSNKQLLYFSVDNTTLHLVTEIDRDKYLSGFTPVNTVLILVFFPLFIFGAMGLLMRSEIQKSILSIKYAESQDNALIIEKQNIQLQAEVSSRIEAEKKLEDAYTKLRRTTAVLSYTFESASEFAIGAINEKLEYIQVNPTAEKVMGVAAEELYGRTIYDVHSYDDVTRERLDRALEIVKNKGKYEFDIQKELGTKDAQSYHAVIMPMLDEEKVIVGYVIFLMETTAQVRAEQKLRQSEKRYRRLVENLPDVIFSIDNTLTILDIHLSNSLSLGFSEDLLIGKVVTKFIYSDDQSLVLEIIENDTKETRQYRHGVCFRVASVDGTIHWVEANVSYQYYEDGRFKNADGVLRDITEQKMLEQQLVQTERLAAAGQLAASIAHEINSPLAGISALLGLLKKQHQESEETLPKLLLIQQAFDNISEIVRKLLDMNRPAANKVHRSHINSIISSTVDLTRAYLRKKRIEVQIELGDSIPDFDCHPQELGQVVLNLINNSAEAISDNEEDEGRTPGGGEIRISTRYINDQIVLDYHDSGPGIAGPELDLIFDPFYTKKTTKGMGLGLALCNEIISRHNGTLRAVSCAGGAHFVIAFKFSANVKETPLTHRKI